jgi:hypothetical protein
LGNTKPKTLQAIEKDLWLMVLNIATGRDQATEITKYMNILDAIDLSDIDTLESDWFVKGENVKNFK